MLVCTCVHTCRHIVTCNNDSYTISAYTYGTKKLYEDLKIEKGVYYNGIASRRKMHVKLGMELWDILDVVSVC